MDATMSKPEIPNIDEVVAIDIHTHAEEPCGMHADDGYDDFQAQMAEYFKSPNKHPPTVQETAAYYRAKKIAAVIFPVDAERETGFRRYSNYEMLEVAADNSDVLIPFVSIDPHKGKLGVAEIFQPDVHGRCGSGFPRPEDHSRAPVVSMAGRSAVGRDPQAERLYRPLRLVAEIFSANSGALHQLDPAGQDAVRLGLAGDHAGPLDGGFRQARDPR